MYFVFLKYKLQKVSVGLMMKTSHYFSSKEMGIFLSLVRLIKKVSFYSKNRVAGSLTFKQLALLALNE